MGKVLKKGSVPDFIATEIRRGTAGKTYFATDLILFHKKMLNNALDVYL